MSILRYIIEAVLAQLWAKAVENLTQRDVLMIILGMIAGYVLAGFV